jgi:DNA-directed RNA polymerase I subunit RPA2
MPTTERCTIQTTGQSANEAIHKPKLRLFCRTPSCIAANQRVDSNDEAVEPIVLPYVYRYLVNELAGMNIKMKLEIA